jgi:hypothetical protein
MLLYIMSKYSRPLYEILSHSFTMGAFTGALPHSFTVGAFTGALRHGAIGP